MRANAEIWRIAQSRGGTTIGSTMAALLTFERQYACIWLGDSRVYLLRDGVLNQLSRDHTEVQELLDRGVITPAEARVWPRRNVITRAVGASEEIQTDIELGAIRSGDVFILNSDGLTAHVSDAEIRDAALQHDPETVCSTLLDMVLERGGTDNVTIVVVHCREIRAGTDEDRTFVESRGLDERHG